MYPRRDVATPLSDAQSSLLLAPNCDFFSTTKKRARSPSAPLLDAGFDLECRKKARAEALANGWKVGPSDDDGRGGNCGDDESYCEEMALYNAYKCDDAQFVEVEVEVDSPKEEEG